MLRIENVSSFYGRIQALERINLEVTEGEIVCLIGANGAGKTTTLMTIMGVVRAAEGKITFQGEDITDIPTPQIVSRGIACVPEGRRIFPQLTVLENLDMGFYTRRDHPEEFEEGLELAFRLFPVLKERARQLGGTLSGGQQQMLALARSLMARPKLLLLDEPSLGLAPLIVEQVMESIVEINKGGTTVLLVEQNALMALEIAHKGFVLETGNITLSGPAKDLLDNEQVQKSYLGTA
ncbi:MAG: ABC transporter ATP-binding protein [Limnochordia bacterium]|jgi:branched-chain amino acid transport system ATP-binding protein